MSQEVYIIDAIRTPIGSFGGTLSVVRPDDMGAMVMKALMDRNASIDPSLVEDVIFGCANQAGE
jgi:acetyl-CoA acyltransferase